MKRLLLALLFLFLGIAVVFWRQSLQPVQRAPGPARLIKVKKKTDSTFSVWVWSEKNQNKLWRTQVNELQRQTGQSVKFLVFKSEKELVESLEKTWDQGNSPDLFALNALDAELFYKQGMLNPLSLRDEDKKNWIASSFKPFLRENEKGKTLAYPSDFSVLALYYNRSFFDRLGVGYPDVHWNWNILLAMSRTFYQVNLKEGNDPIFGVELPLSFDFWEALALQAGKGIYQGENWKLGLPSDRAAQIASLQFLCDYFKYYSVAAPPSNESEGAYFLREHSVLSIAGCELMEKLKENSSLRWGVSPLPRNENRATTMQVEGWAVSSRCNRLEIAEKLARILAKQPIRSEWLPAYRGEGAAALSPEEEVIDHIAEESEGPPILPQAREIRSVINDELMKWISEPKPSVEAFIDKMKTRFHFESSTP